MRRLSFVFPVLLLLPLYFLGSARSFAADTPLVFSKATVSATADLGVVTFRWALNPTNRSTVAAAQFFVHHSDRASGDRWEVFAPTNADGKPIFFDLKANTENSGSFNTSLPKGTYSEWRIVLFSVKNDLVDYSQLLYDSRDDKKIVLIPLNLTVTTTKKRVGKPELSNLRFTDSQPDSSGTYTVQLQADVRIPRNQTADGNGYWVQAKGIGGFAQVWAGLNDARPGGDSADDYRVIPVILTLKAVKPGLYVSDIGLVPYNFSAPLQWFGDGIAFEAGGDSWVKKAKAGNLPPRLRRKQSDFIRVDSGKLYDFYPSKPLARKAAQFLRGGNYGNAVTWTVYPALNRPGYFGLLRQTGCRFVRFNYNPDRYLKEEVYRHVVDQIVQNIWAANLYPVIAPQDLPTGESREERVDKLEQLLKLVATMYKNKPVWIELCNEPSAFDKWSDWKPVAVRLTRAVRSIDPNGFVIVPLEGYGKDARAAAKSPITEVAVDLYDGHAYVKPTEIDTLFGEPIRAGLPLLIGEYGSTDALYLSQITTAMEKLPVGLLASSPWAFTVPGQDNLPLVASGDGSALIFTPAGQVIHHAYSVWDAGKRLVP